MMYATHRTPLVVARAFSVVPWVEIFNRDCDTFCDQSQPQTLTTANTVHGAVLARNVSSRHDRSDCCCLCYDSKPFPNEGVIHEYFYSS